MHHKLLAMYCTLLGGTRDTIDMGIGLIPRRMSQLLYLWQLGNRDLLTTYKIYRTPGQL